MADPKYPGVYLKRDGGWFVLEAKNARLDDVFRAVSDATGVKVSVDANLAETRVNLDISARTAEDLIGALSESKAFVYERDGSGYKLAAASVAGAEKAVGPQMPEGVRSPLDEKMSEEEASRLRARGVLLNTDKSVRAMLRPESKALLLQNAYIDTDRARRTRKSVDVPAAWKAPANSRFFIVQFDHPISAADRELLEKAGATISHYVPHQALAVYADPSAIEKLQKENDAIRFVEPVHPYYKVSPDILAYFSGNAPETVAQEIDRGLFNIMTRDQAGIEMALQSVGAQVLRYQEAGGAAFLTVEMPPAKIQDLVREDSVQWVETAKPRKPMNDLARKFVKAPTFRALHPSLSGAGVIVAVTDTGVDYVNPGFAIDPALPTSTNTNTRIVHYAYRPGGPTSDGIPGDNHGHGTHVSGSILGNGALSETVVKAPGSGNAPYTTNQFAGVAPRARLVMIEDFNSFSDTEQAEIAYTKGARISNNSWGNSYYAYGTYSAIWDALVRDAVSTMPGRQELIAFFAAGNDGDGKDDGTGGNSGTVGEPGNAKNVITVGALEQPRWADNLLNINWISGTNIVRVQNSDKETDSDWQVAYFSSRGPVNSGDPRIKPDIMAPGSYVLSIQSHETNPDDLEQGPLPHRDYRYGNVDSGTNFAFFSGTSMATPIGAGAAALIFEYFTNTFGREPSPAMMKAMMVAGARMCNTMLYRHAPYGTVPEVVDQGWGALDLVRSVDGPRLRSGTGGVILYDQNETGGLNTDQIYTATPISLSADDGGLKVVLAWSDVPGNPGNAVQLVNDLDLVVYGPNGLVYQGNLFDWDGVSSYPLDKYYAALGDAYNNVEVVTIPDGAPGTYTIQVRGYQVPNGPQDFALAIVKGIGREGRIAGEQPAIALTTNGMPVIAYSSIDANSNRQIYVRQWMGSLDDPGRLGMWTRMDDAWFGLRGSAGGQGISRSFERSVDPSVTVEGTNVYVAWVEMPRPPETVSRIFLKQFNGRDWIELNNSARGAGVSGSSAFDALDPVVRVGWNNRPIVAFERKFSDVAGERVFVMRWNGTNWVGLAGSDTNGLTAGGGYTLVDGIAMEMDSSGYPVVAWGNGVGQIEVRRWTGSAWTNIGPIGFSPYAAQPSLAVSANGQIFIAWIQTAGSYLAPYTMQQVFVARYQSGTNWVALGSSLTHPGVSASTNLTPMTPYVAVGPAGSVHVAWRGVASSNTAIFVKRFSGATASWIWAGDADEQYGIARQSGSVALPAAVVDNLGIPTVAFQLGYQQDISYTNEVMVYTLVSDRDPPVFAGLGSARGGTNNNVFLQWEPAGDAISTSIIYRIYRSTQTWACGVQPNCSAGDVFSNLIATVTNVTSFTVTGLTSNRVYCFGVRAADTNGMMEMNTVMRSAGPVTGTGDNDGDCLNNAAEISAGTEPCVWDTDGDGMPDGWEWFYSTNNPLHTNALAMDPLDNGFDKVRTAPQGDGDPTQAPDYDLDGDGTSNYEEYQWYAAYTSLCVTATTNWISPNPTNPDTDGDGMPDGWEILNGFNPINPGDAAGDADGDGLSNLNEYIRGTDPRMTDSDGDGLNDGAEVGLGLDPALADTDKDGLDDAFEIALGSDPRRADTGNRQLSDGDAVQLGWAASSATPVFNVLLVETFETSSRTNWTHRAVNALLPVDLWHLSTADPDPNLSGIRYTYERSTNTSYRYSKGTNFENQVTNNYNGFGAMQAALDSPKINATNTATLFVSWNEYYSTEPNGDFVQVLARGGANTNWVVVTPAMSGKSGVSESDAAQPAKWTYRTADISQFAGQTNVQVRFLFKANGSDNEFPGWYVDDVIVYEGVRISGWVRDINGAPVQGATVRAMGRGGVTNIVGGHRIVLPAKVFGEVKTAADGSYEIRGLPQGRYYVQATAPGHIGEFFNGPLFTGSYGFGAQLNPGVPDRFLVGPAGYLMLTNSGAAYTNAHFELEKGRGRAFLGVIMSQVGTNRYPVNISGIGTDYLARVWNAVTNPGTAAFQTYLTATNPALPLNRPDWLTNAVIPNLLGDLDVGNHEVIPPTNFLWITPIETPLREGDATWVNIGTNHPQGWVKVTAGDGGVYRIWVDYRATTNFTPATIRLPAGTHTILLAPTNVPRIAPLRVDVPRGARADAAFSANALTSSPGRLLVRTFDLRGNVVTDAAVFVNGQRLNLTTPALLQDLLPGTHRITVRKDGYRPAELRSVSVNSGTSNEITFALADADEDYDRVGDNVEIAGYTNIFLYHRNSDPDADGLSNLFEYDQLRLYNIFLNPFDPDTDHDAMSDGAELAYDGVTNLLGVSTLETNVVQGTPTVRVRFVGRYLEGVCNFGTAGPHAVSIEGDRFVAGSITFPALAVPNAAQAVIQFGGISTTGVQQSVSQGHNKDAVVYSDSLPDRVDTDGDGMWDGFEHLYGLATVAQLDPIEIGRGTEDPDFDGLDNYREFLGPDFTANTNDWTSPISSDTDGDGIPDGWEYFYGFDPNDPSDAFTDPDNDGLVNLSEYYAGTNPKLADTDADFLPDFEEVAIYMTDPLNPDTDNDGLIDGREVWDRDLDGVFDGGFFPNWNGGDMDGDGYMDGPTDWDTDGDGMPDGFEVLDEFGRLRNDSRLNPANPNDADDDPDGDGLTNLQEYLVRDTLFGNNPSGVIWDYSSDPFRADSDGDGMPDGWEVYHGLHPMDPVPTGTNTTTERYSLLGRGGDPDSDGLWNYREYSIRFHYDPSANSNAVHSLSTDPWNPDTDEDGLTDGQEDRAFLSNPILQDSDRDRLMDGILVPDRWGEVESELRRSEYLVIPTAGVWTQLAELARVPHPQYPEILGHLAVIRDSNENAFVAGLLGSLTNVAIGATNTPSLLYWVNREAWLAYASWAAGEPLTNRGYLGMVDTNGEWIARDSTHVFNGYVIEWDYVPVVTNHFDQALNDVWLLKWPGAQDLPHWERANVSTNYPWPPARWGHAATYIPVFETKRPRDDRGNLKPETRILLDNRQLVVFGGRDGVTTHKDVWELRVYSNWWVWSQAPMNSQFPLLMDGLTEFQVFTILNYKNTGCVKEDSPWWDADGFGLPKNRPWSNSRSFDWTYVFGGWDDIHRYYETHLYYKSTDDPRPITESKGLNKAVTEFYLWSPGGGNNRFASPLNNGKRFVIGGAGQLFNPDTKPEPQSNYVASGYSAVNIDGFAFRGDCDTIEIGTLTLDVTEAPAASFSVSVFAEVRQATGSSPDDYSSDPDEFEPYVRATSPLYYRTMTTNFTVPAATGPFSIDVTALAQDIISKAPNWSGANIGFVFYTTNASYAVINIGASSITVTYKPTYKVAPYWNGPTRISKVYSTRALGSRKGAAMAYDYKRKVSLVFGGMDGNEVLGDTHEGFYRFSKPPVFDPRGILYVQVMTEKSPPPRWGANLVYDPYKEHFVLFGGFDANHRPLNDLWIYKPQTVEESTTVDEEGNEEITTTITAPAQWIEVKEFASLDRPQPRGGASMIFWGGFDYDRAIGDYCVSGNKKKIVLFGGTDGKTYFNDTWVYDYNRWILVNPVGEQSQSPWPRAFASMVWAQNADSISDPFGTAEYNASAIPPCASPAAILFGGRTGTLPGGRDTDDDMVEDGAEYELGGPSQGRDPRVNSLVRGADVPTETIPYTYLRIGSRPASPSLVRGAIANFESLRHDDGIYACSYGLPWEAAHPDLYSQVTVSCGDSQAGVDADRPDQTRLWYHRYGGENPYDPKDVWELGRPDNTAAGPNAVPPIARSGRWCYGTNLRGTYPNNAIMELYSPLLDLSVPSLNATHTNANSYFLVFWEWVDLKDSNDVIRIDAVRPSTPADVLTRRTGVNRPVLPVLPNRSIAHNTTGEWRKMIVPLDNLGNESNVYLRFTLQTDSSGVAGGWYIDDVAIMQGWEIFGSNLPPYVLVSLYGTNINGNALATTTTDANGNYSFGFLPLGAYNLGVLDGTANINGAPGASSTLEITNITPSAVAKIQWPAVPGLTYRVDYADPSSGPNWNWQPMMTVLASGSTEQHTDPAPQPGRIYRVVILSGP